MKRLFTFMALCASMAVQAQLPSLHVEGRQLKDTHGNNVVLHGVMDTPNPYFNSWRWGYNATDDAIPACLDYFDKLFTAITDTTQGAYCNVFRLHLDPCWTNDPSKPRTGDAEGEANISQYSRLRLRKYMDRLFWPIMERALSHGLYVVVRPPGVCPGTIQVGGDYQDYLLDVWNVVASNDSVRKYAGQVSLELANEPVVLLDAEGRSSASALHDFFQPIADQCRRAGFTGIIWAPGTGWQGNYQGYATYPMEGYNIGYAVHDYTGWYGCSDAHCDAAEYIREFTRLVPVVETSPIIITEVDWSPEKPGEGHYNEHGEWVPSNYGTWSTGSTSLWGAAYKQLLDHYGNISMTLSGTDCYIDVARYLQDGTVTPAFDGLAEACGQACFDWYRDYYHQDYPRPDFRRQAWSDNGDGTYTNPVVRADFPDPDVVRLGDAYYMVTTTMHHFPGATLLKSYDLVNWSYCAQPLSQLSTADKYSLLGGRDSYAQGMWAAAMAEHDGRLYILINGCDAGGFLLSTDDPEGQWQLQPLSRSYYDPGLLFDDGHVYVVCGINHLVMCELDEQFNLVREQEVVVREGQGLEGSHLYHIGDYYYIYSTYGGWPSGQTVFRSKSIWGPYDEHLVLAKEIGGTANTVHQGALVATPSGEWWTVLFQDLGALGRMPNLQPVTWRDGWPVVGQDGVPCQSWQKPDVGGAFPRTALPTHDPFRTYPLGMQWEWNHNPDDGAWSLFERPGWLRLSTSGTATRLTQARNTLTQRIFADADRPTTGTACMDITGMAEGDVAGLAVFQDPYALIGVTVSGGEARLVWQQDTLRPVSGFTPDAVYADLPAQTSVVYLRASVSHTTGKCRFYYSTDNRTWQPLGRETQLGYNLSVFVGARFALFNYATRQAGGHVDVDWFSTEDDFDEACYYPADFAGFSEDMLTATSLDVPGELLLMVGNGRSLSVTATYADGHTDNVAAQARYAVSSDCVGIQNGIITAREPGECTVSISYTDPMGHTLTADMAVSSTYFPLTAEYFNPSIFGEGTFDETTRTLRTAQYGFGGWQYEGGIDLSDYRYLVVQLQKPQSCGAQFRLFDVNNYWSEPYSFDIGSRTQLSIDLTAMTKRDGAGTAPVDPSHLYIAGFWSYGGGDIVIKDIFVSDDGVTPAGVYALRWQRPADGAIYDLAGRRVSQPARGFYIRNGRKFVR